MDPHPQPSQRRPRIRYFVFYDPVLAVAVILLFLVMIFNLTILPLAFLLKWTATEESEVNEMLKKTFQLILFLVGMLCGLVFVMLIMALMDKGRASSDRRRAIGNVLACFPKKLRVWKLRTRPAAGGPSTKITIGG